MSSHAYGGRALELHMFSKEKNKKKENITETCLKNNEKRKRWSHLRSAIPNLHRGPNVEISQNENRHFYNWNFSTIFPVFRVRKVVSYPMSVDGIHKEWRATE